MSFTTVKPQETSIWELCGEAYGIVKEYSDDGERYTLWFRDHSTEGNGRPGLMQGIFNTRQEAVSEMEFRDVLWKNPERQSGEKRTRWYCIDCAEIWISLFEFKNCPVCKSKNIYKA